MDSGNNKCLSCYWCEQCGGDSPCDDCTPLDEHEDVRFYNNILKENAEEYRSMLKEVNS